MILTLLRSTDTPSLKKLTLWICTSIWHNTISLWWVPWIWVKWSECSSWSQLNIGYDQSRRPQTWPRMNVIFWVKTHKIECPWLIILYNLLLLMAIFLSSCLQTLIWCYHLSVLRSILEKILNIANMFSRSLWMENVQLVVILLMSLLFMHITLAS